MTYTMKEKPSKEKKKEEKKSNEMDMGQGCGCDWPLTASSNKGSHKSKVSFKTLTESAYV